jgi:hypothetical protein
MQGISGLTFASCLSALSSSPAYVTPSPVSSKIQVLRKRQMFSCASISPLCFLWPCLAVSMHSANESVYITGKLGAKMGIPVMDHGEGIPAKNSVEDFRFGAPARASVPADNPPPGSHVSGQGRENSSGGALGARAGCVPAGARPRTPYRGPRGLRHLALSQHSVQRFRL